MAHPYRFFNLRVLDLCDAESSQDSRLAQPANPQQGESDVELNFASRTPLEEVERAARDAGVEVASATSDEGIGRQLQLRTPDCLLVKVNEIDAELIS